MTSGQDCVVIAGGPLLQADVTNAAMAVLDVVPAHETGRPSAGRGEVGEALGWELRPVLGGTEQRLGECVVIAHARPRERGFPDALPVASMIQLQPPRPPVGEDRLALPRLGRYTSVTDLWCSKQKR
jgi:hypothetical protein